MLNSICSRNVFAYMVKVLWIYFLLYLQERAISRHRTTEDMSEICHKIMNNWMILLHPCFSRAVFVCQALCSLGSPQRWWTELQPTSEPINQYKVSHRKGQKQGLFVISSSKITFERSFDQLPLTIAYYWWWSQCFPRTRALFGWEEMNQRLPF